MSRSALFDVNLGRLRFLVWRWPCRAWWTPFAGRAPFGVQGSWLLWWGPFWLEWIAPAPPVDDGPLPF